MIHYHSITAIHKYFGMQVCFEVSKYIPRVYFEAIPLDVQWSGLCPRMQATPLKYMYSGLHALWGCLLSMWEATRAYSTYSFLFRSVTSISPPLSFSSTSSICVGCGGGRGGGGGWCVYRDNEDVGYVYVSIHKGERE